MTTKPILALTMGDPAGVGPEIIVKALARPNVIRDYIPVIVGSERALRRSFDYTGKSLQYRLVHSIDQATGNGDGVYLLNDESRIGLEIPLAKVDPACGASAFAWLSTAIELAKQKKVAAIVTAPLHKEALNQAGHHYAGHTEILADQTGTEEFSLMLIAGQLRIVHVTCHVAIQEVPALITRDRVRMTIRLFHQALSRLDGRPPRIAVCALNPHGGEGGLFGDEEIRAIRPAVEDCVAEGIQTFGPMPSDSIYPQVVGGRYDGVVAMYHDQGHIPFKLIHFGFDPKTREWSTVTGVNVTLGLPIIRTSVDHGTAFDLAGTGKASEQSLLDAIEVAVKLAVR